MPYTTFRRSPPTSINGVWRPFAAKRARHACGATVAAEVAIWTTKFKTYKERQSAWRRELATARASAANARNKPSMTCVSSGCFGNLLRDPFGRRMGRHIDPDKLSPCQPDHDKGIEQVKSDGWHNEQIHGGNRRRVIADKGAPTLTGRVARPGHVFGYGRL